MENNKKQSSYWQSKGQSSNSSANPPITDSAFNNNNFSSRRINSSSFSNNNNSLGGGFNSRGNHSNNLAYVVKEQKKVDSKAEGSDDEYKKNMKNNNIDDKYEEAYDVVMKNTIRSKNFRITLSPSESLPPNEQLGGYIFVCNNETMQENLERKLFGLPPRYRDSVRAITPGMPLFLYNFTTHKLHGIFEAAGFGGTNIDPTAWEDKRNPGESCFPAQVRVTTRKAFDPLDDETFREVVHHYDGPKFRLELTTDEALYILKLFAEQNFEEVFKVTYY
ncbi:PREDICTED: B2 protein-like [Lupinus angustifolius]|uniref:B2 protein-like n=1 Tax=Lupinus angustifolius TaxID=3871 RepID=UPI00092F9B15|nr:PREDICTED: B2 protein-like [Lupinus angustifolius]